MDRADSRLEPPPLAHHCFGILGVIPEIRVFDAGVKLVEPPQRAIPIEELAHQRQRRFDLFDMGLPFGTHGFATPRNPALRLADGAGV